MLTRVELLRVSRGIEIADLLIEFGKSRQHLLRIRKGEIEPRRDMIAALVSAFRHLTLEDIQPDDIIELSREESGPWRKEKRSRFTVDVDSWRRERDAAADVLLELRSVAPGQWNDTLRRRNASDAVVRALVFEGRASIDSEPRHAERCFEAAVHLTEQLTDLRREYRVTLLGRAWLELANARRQIGRYGDSLAALDEAERCFEGEPYATKQLGRAWLARGTVLLKMGELAPAERSLRRSINIFAAVDDYRSIARVQLIEAGILFERSDFAGARERWLLAAPALQAANERHSLAVAWLNVGWCDIELNQKESARRWLTKALDAFKRLKCDVEVLRTRWALARLHALFDNRQSGVRELILIRSAFAEQGLLIDAGMVSLDIAEVLLLPPQRASAAAKACAVLPQLFRKGGASREALKAVAYLKEAASSRRLHAPDVKLVRDFLDRADARGEKFSPPEITG